MSGGYFDYDQHRIGDMIDKIQDLIDLNGESNEYGEVSEFSDQDIRTFERAMYVLEMAQIYAQRIDYYVSGDDGPESFHKRLGEDLSELNRIIEKETNDETV